MTPDAGSGYPVAQEFAEPPQSGRRYLWKFTVASKSDLRRGGKFQPL
jgi:hypothetical protein